MAVLWVAADRPGKTGEHKMGNKNNETKDDSNKKRLDDIVKKALRGIWGGYSAPVQLLSDISNKIIPETDFSRTLDQISHPGFLRERKREDYKHLLPPAMATPTYYLSTQIPGATGTVIDTSKLKFDQPPEFVTNPTKNQTYMGAPTRESPAGIEKKKKKKEKPRLTRVKKPKKSRPIIGSTANTRGTYTSRKRTGEGDQGTYRNIRPTMGTPGQDMSAIARKPNRVLRMKGGGIAIKGQGKAFLKSKR